MRNAVIVATAGTDPIALVALLGRHPEIFAPAALRLSALLHGTSRGIVRALKPGPKAEPPVPFPVAHLDTIDLARKTCCSTVDLVFAQLRGTAPASTVIVWDPDGLSYPFIDPPDIHIVLLTRDPASAARRLTGGIRFDELSSVVGNQIAEAIARPRIWGLADERVRQIDEDSLNDTATLRQLLEFLDVASDPAAMRHLLDNRQVVPSGHQTC